MLQGIASILWPLVAGYAVWRLARLGEMFAPKPTEKEPAIPDDLSGVVTDMTDDWAREDMTRLIREKYAESGDWNQVRRAVGVAIQQ